MISEVNFLGKLAHAALLAQAEDSLDDVDSGDLEFKMLESDNMDDDLDINDSDNAEHSKKIQPKHTRRAKKRNIKHAKGESVDIPDIEAELINIGVDTQLQNEATSNDRALNDGPLLLDQKNVCELLWGQYMRAVNFLVKEWGVKPYRILAEGGTVSPISPT
jgi:hypothetical protein